MLFQAAAFLTATLYPGIVFGIGFFVNLFIWGKHSSGAIPFTTMLAVAAMWFGISLPLVYLGYYFGYRWHQQQLVLVEFNYTIYIQYIQYIQYIYTLLQETAI